MRWLDQVLGCVLCCSACRRRAKATQGMRSANLGKTAVMPFAVHSCNPKTTMGFVQPGWRRGEEKRKKGRVPSPPVSALGSGSCWPLRGPACLTAPVHIADGVNTLRPARRQHKTPDRHTPPSQPPLEHPSPPPRRQRAVPLHNERAPWRCSSQSRGPEQRIEVRRPRDRLVQRAGALAAAVLRVGGCCCPLAANREACCALLLRPLAPQRVCQPLDCRTLLPSSLVAVLHLTQTAHRRGTARWQQRRNQPSLPPLDRRRRLCLLHRRAPVLAGWPIARSSTCARTLSWSSTR